MMVYYSNLTHEAWRGEQSWSLLMFHIICSYTSSSLLEVSTLTLNNLVIKCHKHRNSIVCSRKRNFVWVCNGKARIYEPKKWIKNNHLSTYSVFSCCCVNPKLTATNYTGPIVLTFAQNLYFRLPTPNAPEVILNDLENEPQFWQT